MRVLLEVMFGSNSAVFKTAREHKRILVDATVALHGASFRGFLEIARCMIEFDDKPSKTFVFDVHRSLDAILPPA